MILVRERGRTSPFHAELAAGCQEGSVAIQNQDPKVGVGHEFCYPDGLGA